MGINGFSLVPTEIIARSYSTSVSSHLRFRTRTDWGVVAGTIPANSQWSIHGCQDLAS
jgi:hypothetical protein